MAIFSGPLRLTRLDSDGHPTGDVVEVDAFDIAIHENPSDIQEHFVVNTPREIHFTMELCWQPGGKRKFMEAVAGVEFWKRSERIRKRYARLSRKTRRR